MVGWKKEVLMKYRLEHLRYMREYMMKYKQTKKKWWYICAQGRGKLAKQISELLETV